jgi:hypothetical protein
MSDFYGDPIYGFYGYTWPPSWLGSGNPGGDSYGDSVQFGVNIDLLSMDNADPYSSTATLRFRNYSVDYINSISYEVVSGDIQVTYETVVDNVGNETASDVEVYFWLDPTLSIVGASTDSTDGTAVDVEQGAGLKDAQTRNDAAPSDDMLFTISSLDAGEKVTVTVVAEMPFADSVELYSELWAYDGQVDRGPWWLDLSLDFPSIYLPLVVSE